MNRKTALRDFLMFHRSRLSPGPMGLRVHGPRRVAGLRREEVAALASVSVDQYIRLERGHTSLVSDTVVEAVAGALRLTPGERRYLRALAQRPLTADASARPCDEGVRDGRQRILDSLRDSPAYVVGRDGAIVAWNRPAARVFFDFSRIAPRDRSLGRLMFTHPRARSLFLDWEGSAREIVAYLRTETVRRPRDGELAAHVGGLLAESPDFRRLWTTQFAFDSTRKPSRLACPTLGTTLQLTSEAFEPTDASGTWMVIYTADEDSPSADALRRMAAGPR
ncbi:helix-turn-helix transcriptional regulator [Streptomyces hesseae]|uniref:Helix-turn-helix transcriptional regulator n=1 Tax=Streptomyces hesseae TaxID=3075519 RepID=A0ABU2SFU0_9ACTN|nr:helix-turn-helix transcriptional regulator [Streptomyces sp. DSM 40473]MDT0447820.1 helix-turn-helix transcriptional regulator [Streptomyces sp. DSM 40473]